MSSQPQHRQFTSSATATPLNREQIVWVPIEKLQLGMYVHPLSRESFLLRHQKDLEEARGSGVKGLFVDLARCDQRRQIRTATSASGKTDGGTVKRETSSPTPPSVENGGSRRTQAFEQAAGTLANLRAPVERLLNDVRLGRIATNGTIRGIVAEITNSVAANPSGLISLARIRSKDAFTYAHSIAVCALMANLAARMGLDAGSQQELAVAGLLHDVGKMLVPDEVLKKPGQLSHAEMEIMRSHVTRGYDLLKAAAGLPAVALDVCLHHHEKIDGSGYPIGLSGNDISLPARMAAVCDVYDAITSSRPYKEAWTPSESLADMFTWRGHFDREVLSAFIKSVGIYPVGSLLRMASGHLALVLEQHEWDLTRPLVRLFYAIDKRRLVPFQDLNLGPNCEDSVVGKEDPQRWGFADWDNQWPRMLKA